MLAVREPARHPFDVDVTSPAARASRRHGLRGELALHPDEPPMIRKLSRSLFALGYEPGGVGEPCSPEDEYQPAFSGFGVTEVNVESRSYSCETRVCLVNHFQGRVSCPYGQTAEEVAAGNFKCKIPGS